MDKLTILGAGLAGISVSAHAGHGNCRMFEKQAYAGGHIHTEFLDGFTWDEGPHLSFTKHQYVKDLFAANVDDDYLEYPVVTGNYFRGDWIPHPAQSNLYSVPEPLRSRCVEDFLQARKAPDDFVAENYKEWLHFAFGKTFAETFPSAYTRKYWTTEPENLSTDWVGKRMYFPSVSDVTNGAKGPLPEQTHYIKAIRYPNRGGFCSYARRMMEGAAIGYNRELTHISFKERELLFANGERHTYEQLAITLPLPLIIHRSDAPGKVRDAADRLRCSSVLLVNVTADHPTVRPENWIYVYDEDKYTTRINCTEKLSPNNAPAGKTGIQVEVYFSEYSPRRESSEVIARKVCQELLEMGLVTSPEKIESVHTRWVQWANVIFDHERREALDTILQWLEGHGLEREADDLDPTTDWDRKLVDTADESRPKLVLAGRYAQWKYFWTDDCVMRGLYVGKQLGFPVETGAFTV